MLWTSMMNLVCCKQGPFVERNKLRISSYFCANYFCKDKTRMLRGGKTIKMRRRRRRRENNTNEEEEEEEEEGK